MPYPGFGVANLALRPNNSFKPNPLRSGNGVAGKACHAVACTTQVGLTQALGCGGASALRLSTSASLATYLWSAPGA